MKNVITWIVLIPLLPFVLMGVIWYLVITSYKTGFSIAENLDGWLHDRFYKED